MSHGKVPLKQLFRKVFLLFIGGILLLSCGCNKTQQFAQKLFECPDKEGPFTFFAVCSDTVYKDNDLIIFCVLKNNTSQSYEIQHAVSLIDYLIDGMSEPSIAILKKTTIAGNSVFSINMPVKLKETGEHNITVYAKFDVLDEENNTQEKYYYEINIPIIVK